MVQAFSVHRPFPVVAYHNDCPLENVLRHLNMRTEHYTQMATKELNWRELNWKKWNGTKWNEIVFVFTFILIFSLNVAFAIHSLHSIWFIFMELFLISLMEKLCKLLALCVRISFFFCSYWLPHFVFLSLMLTNYKQWDGLPTRS